MSLSAENDGNDMDREMESDLEIFLKLEDENIDIKLDHREINEELAWRLAKVELEEANERSFLKRIRSIPWKILVKKL